MSAIRVLFVDDDRFVLESVAFVLEEHDFEVFQAPDAETAIELLKGVKVDVILSDLRMPGISGIQLATFCLQFQPGTPIVIHSGNIDSDEHAPKNVFAMLTKPVQTRQLVQTLNLAVSSK
jgi:DNA-binding NtrC family response regulator